MSLFNFNIEELYTFFAVLMRYSVLFSVLPFVGDRVVPAPVKVLLAFSVSIALFPALVATGSIHPGDAVVWARTPVGIINTIALEILFGLAIGFTARLAFDGISFGANLVGTAMGFAAAASYDPHQETQTQVIAQIQTAIAMLIFLTLDGHHLMLKASLESYHVVGIGKAAFSSTFNQKLTHLTAEVIRLGIQIAAPVAISLFSVNIVFGIMSKAMPQLNIFMLSFSVTAIIGFFVMLISMPEFQGAVAEITAKVGEWIEAVTLSMAGG